MAYVSPAAMKEAASTVKPISQKKEFEQLIRSIRTIAANTRAFSGDLIFEINKQTDASANGQIKKGKWVAGSQLGLPLAAFVASSALAWFGKIELKDVSSWMQAGSKAGDVIQGIFGLSQLSHQAESQRTQQALSQYNSFDSRMQSIIQSIDSAQQRLQQKEMEEASNR
jgi:hypothetical protein